MKHGYLTACLIALATLCHNLAWSQTPASEQVQPRVTQIMPALDVPLPSQGVFAVLLNKPLANKPMALCDVWGIRSSIPVEHITDARRAAVLKAYQLDPNNLLWTVLRCQTTFPDGAAVTLRWLKAERSANRDDTGNDNWEGQGFHYTAQNDLPVTVHCERSNARSSCNPMAAVNLVFSKLVVAGHAAKIVLRDSKGTRYPGAVKDAQDAASTVAFIGLPANTQLTVAWPNELDEVPSTANKGPGSRLLAVLKSLVSSNKPLLSAEARRKTITVVMGEAPPLVKFSANFGVAEKTIGGVVPLTVRGVEGKPNAGTVKLRQLHVTDEASIIELMQTLNKITRADDSGYGRGTDEEETPVPQGVQDSTQKYAFAPLTQAGGSGDTRSVSWLKRIKSAQTQDLPKQLEGDAFEVLGIPLKESGLHILEAESLTLGRQLLDKNKPMYVRSGALVTDLAVHLHASNRTVAVWVTQLSTGKPAASAAVSVYDCKAKKLTQGSSNAQGLVQFEADLSSKNWDCPLFVFAKKDGDISFVQSDWQRGIESWRFEGLKNNSADTSQKAVHTVLARNLLKGGETLYAKHYWRALNSRGEWVAPKKADLPSTLKLVHQGSNDTVTLTLEWDARGNAQTVYKIPDGAKRGVYQIMLGTNDCYSDCLTQYRIEDFRLPVLKAEVVSPKTPQYIGDTFNVLMRLNYLSGGAAAGERVSIAQRLLKHTPRFGAYADFDFGMASREQADFEDAIDSVVDTKPNQAANTANQQNTEDAGHTLNANGTLALSSSVKKSNGQALALLTQMEYRDPNGETYRAQGRTIVWPSAVVLGSKTESWTSGANRRVEFIALTPDGRPMIHVPIDVQGGYAGYVVHRRRTVGGFYGYHSEQKNDPLTPLCAGRSDAAGRFVCEFKPKLNEIDSGEFRIQATATDAQSRKSMTATTLWLYNGDEVWFGQGDHDRMDVLADKPAFSSGETATLQVRSPFREATAWVSVMRSGVVIDTLVLPLSGKNPSIRLPIKPSYEPNVFVNVLAVRGRVADPAPTALIDLARPAFKLGLVHLDVAGKSHELGVKVSTDKAMYQSRETAVATVQVSPPAGKPLPSDKEVTVFAIDEALLELLPNDTWNIISGMFAQRGYGFETASMSMQVMGRRHYGRKALPAGGGGGKSAARELFETLLLWQGNVKLDANGKATVNIPVNDSLTRFRVVAVANAGADLFGTGHASFTASKDLQILSGLPQSVREGDAFAAGFTLRNTTAQAMQVGAVATIDGVQSPPQTVALAPGEAKTVYWPAPVPLDAKIMNWRVDAASGDGKKDAIVIKLPVTPALTAVRYTVGAQSLDGKLVWPIQPPNAAVAGKGELRVSVSPAFATDAASIRDYMRSYPFYCLEQRTSKAVSLRDAALWGVISSTIDQYVTESGLVNYYPGQNGNDNGYDVLTSFVLSASHEASFKLPEPAQKKMLQGLVNFVTGKLERKYDYYGNDDGYGLTERKLLALEAIARHQAVPLAWAESLKLSAKDLTQLSNRAVVQWLDVLNRVDWANKVVLQTTAMAEFNRRLSSTKEGGKILLTKANENRWYWMYSEDATNAKAALLALDTPLLKEHAESLARGALSTQRGGGHWWQTQANVWGSLMLDKRAAQAAGGIAGTTSMTVGGQTMHHDWAKSPSGESYLFDVKNIASLAINHVGTGKPYVFANALAWSDIQQLQSNNATVSKTIKPIKQALAGKYSAGDVYEITVKFSVSNRMGWVAVTDPIPTGATVLGAGLKGLGTVENSVNQDSQRGQRNADGSYEAWPAYIERTATAVRGYYEYLWGDQNTMTYQVRLNNVGAFKLPPTQVEAMYDPNYYAYRPNEVMEVK